jgi:hypothetical protein
MFFRVAASSCDTDGNVGPNIYDGVAFSAAPLRQYRSSDNKNFGKAAKLLSLFHRQLPWKEHKTSA